MEKKERYRAAIYVDIFDDNIEDAAKRLEKLVKSIPNSFSDGISKHPHGSKVSLV
tara:strand:- start:10858 stop:11022 length:165 start_codon:yes stop_codon:yes gene_type:complete